MQMRIVGLIAVAMFVAVLESSAAPPLPLDKQIEYFRKRVAAREKDYSSRAILGRLYLKQAQQDGDGSRYDDAEDIFRDALKINPNDPGSLLGLSSALSAQHQFAEALELAQKVYRKDPEQLEALAEIGDAQLELGQYDEAEASFKKLHEQIPTAPVLGRLARIAEIRGQQQEGVELLTRALRLATGAGADKKEQSWYQQRIGELELQRGRLDDATRWFNIILIAVPDDAEALPALALVQALQGKLSEAEKLYRRALELRPTETIVIALADLKQVQGKTADAQALYAIAREHLEHAVDVEDDAQAESPQKASSTEATATKPEYDFAGKFVHTHSHRYASAHQRHLSLFYSEHDLLPKLAVKLARQEFKIRQDVYTHDALAWALYRNGDYAEAARESAAALKPGTRDAKLYFHAGMIQLKLGNRDEAKKLLAAVAEINPHFSLLDRDLARTTLAELTAKE